MGKTTAHKDSFSDGDEELKKMSRQTTLLYNNNNNNNYKKRGMYRCSTQCQAIQYQFKPVKWCSDYPANCTAAVKHQNQTAWDEKLHRKFIYNHF